MKKFLLSWGMLVGLIFSSSATTPDEGMWMPINLKKKEADMKKAGLKLSADELYNVQQSSLKDAIVWFNGGCTGEIISSQGLVLTNHHCGYDAIATLSTKSDNILDNGFWAANKGEERPVKGMWVSIVVRMEDVTEKVMAKLKNIEEKDRADKLRGVYRELTAEATKGTVYEAQVREMFKGNAFYMFVFEKFTDIRLVGTPPQNVGKFGGDTDNWMWPRHTGDFSMFRIYANAENKPATYNTTNVPYKPKHSLPINIAGVSEGDYAMIYGFPGRTNRYEFSNGIKLATEKINPTIVALRDVRLKAWKEVMDKNVEDRLKLSADYASIANYWKYYIGQTEQLKRLKVYEQKKAMEADFSKFAANKPEFNGIFDKVNTAYANYEPYALQRTYLQEGILASTMGQLAAAFIQSEKMYSATDTGINAFVKQVAPMLGEVLEAYFTSADQKIVAQHLAMYYKDIPAAQHPELIAQILKKYKAESVNESFNKYAAFLYEKSIFGNKEKLNAFFQKPNLKTLQKDPGFIHFKAFYNNYIDKYKVKIDEFNIAIAPLGRSYVKGLMDMNPETMLYPDANSSLRLTYGKVQSYDPKDAVHFEYQTTLDGVMEKYVPGDFEFDLPSKLMQLYSKKDFGRYAMNNGKMPVAFITNNDITGGNSGSPVIDGQGNLIGLAFDGNWEAMSGDIVFDQKYKRTINVDIRYVLFLIEKLGNAPHIVNEMNLIRPEPTVAPVIEPVILKEPAKTENATKVSENVKEVKLPVKNNIKRK